MAPLILTALILGPLLVGLLSIMVPRPLVADLCTLVLGAALVLLLVPLSGLVLAEGPLILDLGGHPAPVAIPLYVDGLSLAMLWLASVLALAVHSYAATWMRWTAHAAANEYRALWLLLWSGLNGLFLSADLFNIYVMLEITTLGAVPLVALTRGGQAVSAAARYLFFALVGSILFLLGVAVVYADTGLLYVPMLAGEMAATPAALVALLAMTIGTAMKAALFPVHAWLPLAHASAPAPASALLSAVVAKAGAYLVLRLWLGSFEGAWSPAIAQGIGALGAAGILYGSVQALRQARVKRIVAYSTVAQLGYLLLLIPLANSLLAWHGVIYHAVVHGLAKAAIFLAAGNLILALGDDRLENLAGSDHVAPRTLLVLGLSGVAIAGLPPTGGFIAKWWLLSAALELDQGWWVAVVLVGGLLAAAYVFRILRHALLSPDPYAELPQRTAEARLPSGLRWPPMLLALAALALGFAGSALTPYLEVGAGAAAVPGGAP